MNKKKRTITGLQLLTVSLAKAGTGKNSRAGIVLAKAGVSMSPEEIKAALTALEAALTPEQMGAVMALVEAGKQTTTEPVDKADPPSDEPVDKADPPPEDKEPDEVAKAHADAVVKAEALVAKAERERDEVKAELAKRDEAEALAGYVAKAKTQMIAIPGTKPEEIGVLLKAVADKVGEAEAAKLVAILSGASTAIAKSALLKAVGSGDDAVGTEAAKLRHEIGALRKARPELTDKQAITAIADRDPALVAAAYKE